MIFPILRILLRTSQYQIITLLPYTETAINIICVLSFWMHDWGNIFTNTNAYMHTPYFGRSNHIPWIRLMDASGLISWLHLNLIIYMSQSLDNCNKYDNRKNWIYKPTYLRWVSIYSMLYVCACNLYRGWCIHAFYLYWMLTLCIMLCCIDFLLVWRHHTL